MRFARKLRWLAIIQFLLSIQGLSQVECFRTCVPNPSSPTYSVNASSQVKPQNARGTGRLTVPAQAIGTATALLGSQSYSYAIPILHLPGRAGLDLDLTAFYNSAIWTFDPSNNSVTFNADHDWPSYGFRLDFGLLESVNGAYFLVERDGTKHGFSPISNGSADSTDSTYIHLVVGSNSATVTYKSGVQVLYQLFSSTQSGQPAVLWRPVQISDTNGNFISITYASSVDQQINSITDTVGRVIQFNYDVNGNLTSITSNSGAHTWATFSWNSYSLSYNFSATVQDSPANSAALSVLTGITFPSKTGYSFSYGAWGIVNQITNLSGSNPSTTRSYQSYSFPDASAALAAPPAYTTEKVFDGTNTTTWSYSTTLSGGLVSQSTITDPAGTATITNLITTAGDWQDGLVSSVQVKDSGSNLQREFDNTWTSDTTTNTNPRLSSLLTILSDGGQKSRVDYLAYDSYGNVTDQKEYDFGLVLKREILSTYSTAYTTSHILDLLTQTIVKDASGNNIARTDLAYDETSPTAIPGAANHNDSYSGQRGNLTSVTRYTDPVKGAGGISRSFSYDSLGNLLTAQLDCCNQKQWTFSGTTQYAYPDSIVRGPSGLQLTTSATYNVTTGTVATSTDENGQVTKYQYDSSNRLSTVTRPDAVTLTYSYDDTDASPSVSISNSANSAVQKTVADGLGRTLQQQVLENTTLVSSRDSQYDDVKHTVKNSNPYTTGETPVWTTSQLDALGRVTKITPPSGGNYQTAYSGNTTTVTDPAGNQRQSIVDYAGRLIEVDEPTGGTSASGSGTVNGTEQSAQVLVSPATPGTGSVQMGGAVQWKNVAASGSTGGTASITITGGEQQYPPGQTPGTGTITFSGTEQVIAAIKASASVSGSGSLQSKQVLAQAATGSSGNVNIQPTAYGGTGCDDQGNGYSSSMAVTVGSWGTSDGWGCGITGWTPLAYANALAGGFGGTGVSASPSGSTYNAYVNFQSTSAGSASNYPIAATDDTNYPNPSAWFHLVPSGATMTGGQDAVYTTLYDFGTAKVTVNGTAFNSPWSGASTSSGSIAQGLNNQFGGNSLVNVGLSGSTLTLTSQTAGAAGNYSLACSTSYDSNDFSSPSFALSCPSALSGGKDAIYDSGTVTITVNGHATKANWGGSGTTAAGVASAVAAAINADSGAAVSASASGATVTLTAKITGGISNYTFGAPQFTFDSGHFSQSSFSATTSGSALTGGAPPAQFVDKGAMTIGVNGTNYQIQWGANDSPGNIITTPGTIASALASALGSDPTVTSTLSGATVYLNPKTPGKSYSFSTSYTYDTTHFSHSSFTPANQISDFGTATVSVKLPGQTSTAQSDTVSWAGLDTPATIATALANKINADPAKVITAGASGGTVSLSTTATGANTNDGLTTGVSFDSTDFTSASFTTTPSGATLTAGANAVYKTVYDTGTVTLMVGGFQTSVPYGQNSTQASIAAALASFLDGNQSTLPVTATVSGSTLALAAINTGQESDYALAWESASNQSGTFSQPSFSMTVSGSAMTGGKPASFTNAAATQYAYDVLGDLVKVTQGAQTRNYQFDALGRMTSATLPEDGTSSFTYTDFGAVSKRTDARGVATTYSYDGLHRLTGKSYGIPTGSTVAAMPNICDPTSPTGTNKAANTCMYYDQGGATAFALGRLTAEADSLGTQMYTYDQLGRTTQMSRVINNVTYNVKYGYNAAGELSSLTYPSGRVVNPAYDDVGRMTGLSDSSNHYLSSINYNSALLPTGFTYGNGVQASFGYNDHLQLSSLNYTSGSNTLLNLTYNYQDTNSNNTGQIQNISDSRGTAYSTSYIYDPLGRLAQAETGDLTSANTWRLAWSYDRYGNRLSQTLVGGTASAGQPQLTVDPATNHLTNSGFAYDAAGNMTKDGNHVYTFDGEGEITQVDSSAIAYAYDGHRWRIQKTVNGASTVYVYSGSRVLAEYPSGGAASAPSREYIYSGSNLVATLSGTAVTYHHPDHLSNRVETDGAGNVTRTFGHLPFGDSWYETGTADKWKFTGYERDSAESGLDYALNRFYSSGFGRFVTRDLLSGTQSNPQSLNRYGYVTNDPVNFSDKLGLNRNLVSALPPQSGTCTLEGIFTPCSLVLSVIGAGAGMQCPANVCSGAGWVTDSNDPNGGHWQLVQFWAFANGGFGYYAHTGPGALYYSVQGAGKASALYMYQEGDTHEYHSNIYADKNGVFSFTTPEQGPDCAALMSEESDCGWTPDLTVPNGTSLAGTAHTHPDVEGMSTGDFSPTDINEYLTANPNGPIFGFVNAPPGNRVLMFDPNRYGPYMNGLPGAPPPVCVLTGPLQGISKC